MYFEGGHVWKTELGWVLSGLMSGAVPAPVSKGVMQTGIERLWEMEEPIKESSPLPAKS